MQLHIVVRCYASPRNDGDIFAHVVSDSNIKQPRNYRHTSAFPRRNPPESCRKFPPREQRAQGRPGARCTRGLACKKVQRNAHEHTGSAEAIRPSLRNGFTAYNVLSPVIGLFCHRRLADTSARLERQRRGVRTTRLRRPHHTPFVKSASASIASRPASVTIASRPSGGTRRAQDAHDLEFGKAEYFLRAIWTDGITLNWLGKLVFRRRAFYVSLMLPTHKCMDDPNTDAGQRLSRNMGKQVLTSGHRQSRLLVNLDAKKQCSPTAPIALHEAQCPFAYGRFEGRR